MAFTAIDDDEVVGFFTMRKPTKSFDVLRFGFVVVDPGKRGKGYGKQALSFVEQFAKARGCKRLQFQSEVTNSNAMEFYISQGYNPTDMKFYVKYFG